MIKNIQILSLLLLISCHVIKVSEKNLFIKNTKLYKNQLIIRYENLNTDIYYEIKKDKKNLFFITNDNNKIYIYKDTFLMEKNNIDSLIIQKIKYSEKYPLNPPFLPVVDYVFIIDSSGNVINKGLRINAKDDEIHEIFTSFLINNTFKFKKFKIQEKSNFYIYFYTFVPSINTRYFSGQITFGDFGKGGKPSKP